MKPLSTSPYLSPDSSRNQAAKYTQALRTVLILVPDLSQLYRQLVNELAVSLYPQVSLLVRVINPDRMLEILQEPDQPYDRLLFITSDFEPTLPLLHTQVPLMRGKVAVLCVSDLADQAAGLAVSDGQQTAYWRLYPAVCAPAGPSLVSVLSAWLE